MVRCSPPRPNPTPSPIAHVLALPVYFSRAGCRRCRIRRDRTRRLADRARAGVDRPSVVGQCQERSRRRARRQRQAIQGAAPSTPHRRNARRPARNGAGRMDNHRRHGHAGRAGTECVPDGYRRTAGAAHRRRRAARRCERHRHRGCQRGAIRSPDPRPGHRAARQWQAAGPGSRPTPGSRATPRYRNRGIEPSGLATIPAP